MRILVPLCAAMLLAPSALAQDLRAIERCADIAADAERLACYDREIATLSARAREAAARRQQEQAAAARAREEAQARSRVENFGAEAIARAVPEEDEEASTLEARLAEVLTDRNQRGIFILDNGQMWRQVHGAPPPLTKEGDPVRIRRGTLGSYRLTLQRQRRTVPVTRMR